jgi:hypothetical protein
MLRPEKIYGENMTAQASHPPFQCIDIHTGELFATTKDQCQVKANQVQCVLICHLMRVNHFILMARLAQYWLILLASPWSMDEHYTEDKNTDWFWTDQANIW